MNPHFRRGPAKGAHPTTDHRGYAKVRKHAVSETGYCQLCSMSGDDVPGTGWAWWQVGKEKFRISVCDAHVDDRRLAEAP